MVNQLRKLWKKAGIHALWAQESYQCLPDPLMIALEGIVVLKLSNVPWPTAIILLLGTLYVHNNIQYPPGVKNVFALLESVILGQHDMERKE